MGVASVVSAGLLAGLALVGCSSESVTSATTAPKPLPEPIAIVDDANPLQRYPRRAGATATDTELAVQTPFDDSGSEFVVTSVERTGRLQPAARSLRPRAEVVRPDDPRGATSRSAFGVEAPFDRADGVRVSFSLRLEPDARREPGEEPASEPTVSIPASLWIDGFGPQCMLFEVATGRVHNVFTREASELGDSMALVLTFAVGNVSGPFDIRCEFSPWLYFLAPGTQDAASVVWRLDV